MLYNHCCAVLFVVQHHGEDWGVFSHKTCLTHKFAGDSLGLNQTWRLYSLGLASRFPPSLVYYIMALLVSSALKSI